MQMQQERKLASIRRIAEVQPIPNADKICAYRVDGWWVVDSIGKYNVGDLVVYLEIDSWVPTTIAPFLTKAGHEPKEFEGVKGERLRTVKLRGVTSQGLLLPVEVIHNSPNAEDSALFSHYGVKECGDVTEILGILKYEKPLPAALAGMAKGNFPSFIPKTDQPRIQNCTRLLQDWKDEQWEVSEKIDGSSMTVYCKTEFENGFVKEQLSGVCSRNLDLKFDEKNSFWEAAVKYDLINKIFSTGRNLAIQGELVGEGIQGNSYKLIGRQFFCFDIWDIDRQKYLLPKDRQELCKQLRIQHVPVIEDRASVNDWSVSSILGYAEGKSSIGCQPEREGLVFKSCTEHDLSFKAVSNRWLIKGGE